jgi:hypothetical protein
MWSISSSNMISEMHISSLRSVYATFAGALILCVVPQHYVTAHWFRMAHMHYENYRVSPRDQWLRGVLIKLSFHLFHY